MTALDYNPTTGVVSTQSLVVGTLQSTGYQEESTADGISAAGTTQAGATQLSAQMNNVTTVASGAGVKLPPSVAGMQIVVNNDQATNALDVYPSGTDKINALSAGAAYSHAVSSIVIYVCFTAGQWFTK